MTAAAKPECDFLARQGAVADEQGESIAAHLDGCATCRARLGEIEAIRRDLSSLPAARPRDHWEQAVYAHIDRKRLARVGTRKWWAWLPIAGAAAIALVAFLRPRPAQDDGPPSFAFHFDKPAGAAATRGDVVAGDTLVLNVAKLAGAAQLRVYQDGRGLRLQCADAAPCVRTGATLTARWTIPTVGRYRVMLVTTSAGSPAAIPASTGGFDDDVAALAARSDVSVRIMDTFEVW